MTDMLAQAALSLSVFPLSVLAKATVIVAGALIGVRYAHGTPASMRHLVLALAFAVLLALPLAELAAPSLTVSIGRPQTALALGPIVIDSALPAAAAIAAAPAASPDAEPVRSAGPTAAALLAAAWATGAVVCLVPVLLTPWRLRQLRRTGRPWQQGHARIRALVPDVSRRRMALLVHDEVTAPFTYGIVHPAIVLPADAPQWSDDEIERALVHELEHVHRADWAVHLATRVVCALYWFHPLTWVAWRKLSLESERACDDAVLRVAERTAYAQQLVTLARRHMRPSPIPVLSMADRSDLSARIAAVLDDAQTRGRLGLGRASAIVAAAALLVAAVAPLRAAQNPPPAPSQATAVPAFDVVSIKENRSGADGQRMQRQPGRIVVSNFPLRGIIINSFGLQPQQLVGGPDWIDSIRYDITAQYSGEVPLTEPGSVGPPNLMMQRALADRFSLVVHTETREMPIYELILARSDRKLGPRITTAATDCEALMNAALKSARLGGPPPAAPQLPDGRPACGMRFGPGGRLAAGGTSIAALARSMSGQVGRIVVDRTGLTGGFDLELEFTPDPAAAPGGATAPVDANSPSLFTALEEQLGLKLQPRRGPVEVLVIDRVERPTEN